ncbi:hypothetical protein ACA910_021571 [Epithemia clementina (nom. ined.)]
MHHLVSGVFLLNNNSSTEQGEHVAVVFLSTICFAAFSNHSLTFQFTRFLGRAFSHLSIHPFPGTSVLGLGGDGSGAGFSTSSSAVLPLSSLEAATAGHALVEHEVLGANGRLCFDDAQLRYELTMDVRPPAMLLG